MVFSSYFFIVWFLPLALIGYYALPPRHRALWLTSVSYVFYGWWRPEYCVLLAAVTVLSYVIGGRIARSSNPSRARLWLGVGVTANLSALGFFKYAGMFAVWAQSAASLFGVTAGARVEIALDPFLAIALPIGISFYVFQAISYLVDVYRRDAPEASGLVRFASYISMFPQLIAGPIVRYEWIAHQLRERSHTTHKFILGVRFFAFGLAKKVLLADLFANAVPLAFGPHQPGFAEAWTGSVAYMLQIYFDFSAYSDMAVGLGLMLGFTLPKNFDSPYKSASITEFWRRWHISLSSFLRDYLYIPLGGNRGGRVRTYVNLIIVMGLGGLWHGASVLFIIWGLWHGVLLAIERYLGDRHAIRRIPHWAAVGVTSLLVLVGWVPFRAEDPEMAVRVLLGLSGAAGSGGGVIPVVADVLPMLLLPGLAFCWLARNSWEMSSDVNVRLGLRDAIVLAVSLAAVLASNGSPFLYFQF